ncbi:insecticidal delta-endotoxin Cry8Ea1 family protein [Bacillus thuringiensis]|uniref:insecticidal delta-endotoxin Cry8Ea1 family protein n=1 Tax=Bacillus thuringiensis TaxID=1428 RepID=UPI002AB51359|nr:insecticidal delta-endotoxin Cry8Ea1 family protein [Bacillus thuringiensis]MDY7965642.1 insecticidal delta-endotoxin Cry8Ea1 family protein [Bacillus thuringiensis]
MNADRRNYGQNNGYIPDKYVNHNNDVSCGCGCQQSKYEYEQKQKNGYNMNNRLGENEMTRIKFPFNSYRKKRYPASLVSKNQESTIYKGWLVNCDKNTLVNIEPTQAAAAVSTATISTGTIIALSFPVIGSGLIVLGTILPLFWSDSNDDQSTWENFIQMTEEATRYEINANSRSNAIAELRGLQTNFNEFIDSFYDWYGNKNDQSALNKLLNQLDVLNFMYNRAMSHFAPINRLEDQILLLPIYAYTSFFHLTLLSYVTIYGTEWGLSPTVIARYESNQLSKLKEYTKHCTSVYYKGLSGLSLRNVNWNMYNTYRRNMTISVLDIVALFPYCDKRKYPMPVKYELTREVYTDALNFDGSLNEYYELGVAEEKLTRNPRLFSWLNTLNFYEQDTNEPNNFFTSHFYTAKNTNATSTFTSPIFGNQNPSDLLLETGTVAIPSTNYIYSLTTLNFQSLHPDQYNNINEIRFFLTNGVNSLLKNIKVGGIVNRNLITNSWSLPPMDQSPILGPTNYSHILSFMKAFNSSNVPRSIVYSFAWTHRSVDDRNRINLDKITILPAVKAYVLGANSRVVAGPGHTGGDIVNLKDRMELQCFASTSRKSYYIRLRYAANGLVSVALTIPGISGQPMTLRGTFSGQNYSALDYNEFDYQQFPNQIDIPQNQSIYVLLQRTNQSSSEILIIDKIEFLPID